MSRLSRFIHFFTEDTRGQKPTPTPTKDYTVTGVSPLVLANAVAGKLKSLTQYGKCVQSGTATPIDPKDIYCNNGAVKYGVLGKNWFDVDTVGIAQGAISSSDGGNSSSTYRVRTAGYVPVKPNTQYTLSATIDGYTSGTSRGVFVLEYSEDSVAGYTGDSSGWRAPAGYTFTTGATTKFIRIVFAKSSGASTPTAPANISNVQIELGNTATAYEPYKGMGLYVDGTPEVISVGGKNLFNPEGMTGGYIDTNGDKIGNSSWQASDFIPVLPNTQYYFNPYTTSGSTAKHAYYAADKTFIGYIASGARSFTTPADCAYMRFSVRNEATDIQLEYGNEATDYEPYKGEPQTASVVNLFAVGDNADTQDIISGAVTRRVVARPITENENAWAVQQNSGLYRFRCRLDDALYVSGRGTNLLCSHFEVLESGMATGGCFLSGSSDIEYLFFVPTDQTIDTVDKWKAYLTALYNAGTPVMVVYPLATPVTESAEGQKLNLVDGTNIISVAAEVSGIELEATYVGVPDDA